MDDNPYASPQTVSSPQTRVEPPAPRRGLLAMLWTGGWVGGLFGGVFGALAGTLIGAFILVTRTIADVFMLLSAGAMGLIFGVVLGTAVGPLLGTVAALSRRRDIRRSGAIGAALASAGAYALGQLGGAVLLSSDVDAVGPDGWSPLAVGAGVLSGVVGAAGGLLASLTLVVMAGDDPLPASSRSGPP